MLCHMAASTCAPLASAKQVRVLTPRSHWLQFLAPCLHHSSTHRANNAAVKLAGLQSALALISAPTPAIAAPPSAASPEVKALASREEAAMVALSRCEWVE
jgi:hypothetical protein